MNFGVGGEMTEGDSTAGQLFRLSSRESSLAIIDTIGKRVFECAIAIVLVVLLAPLFVAIALAIRIDSRGPIIFRQRRYGENQREILVSKFRTMRHDGGDAGGRRQASRDDPRVTWIGRILRTTCLDELPQLFDVIAGRMALVGPRPHPVDMEIESQPIELVVQDYHMRHRVRPGITGLAQIRGNRGPVTSIEMGQERVDYDNEYIEARTVLMDLRILALTLAVPFKRGVCY